MNWEQELKTPQAREIFEILMDAGADMETVLNTLRFTIPKETQQEQLLKIIKENKLVYPNEIIMAAIEIDESENPDNYS